MINWEELSANMKSAVVSTLENITFSFVDDYPDDFSAASSDSVEADLSVILAETTLNVRISVPKEFLHSIVSTLYPQAEESEFSSIYTDTLNELSNTICGIFFRSTESSLGAFQLGIPHPADREDVKELATYHFLLDDQYPIKIDITN